MQIELKQARPVLKWAGGKSQLLEQMIAFLPEALRQRGIHRYVEPFIGGGAFFFYMAQRFPELDLVIEDINAELILLYQVIQENVEELISRLSTLSDDYLSCEEERKRIFFYDLRQQFNDTLPGKDTFLSHEAKAIRASQIIFLNRTCFNGLFRVNAKGHFNVPFGKYPHPIICDAENLRVVAQLLKRTKILSGDFSLVEPYVDAGTFVYFDPPYRPISQTASFNAYSKHSFDDAEQIRLAHFFRELDKKGAKLMLSNSDPKNEVPTDNFFEDAYKGFRIERVKAARIINSKAEKRGQIHELLVMNY